MNSEDIYLKSPLWLQQVFINLQGWKIARTRLGAAFHRELERFNHSDPSVPHTATLRNFLITASGTEFWRRRFSQYDLNLQAEDIVGELKKLPILSKQEVKENIHSLQNLQIAQKIIWHHTSGTTGSGLIFPQTVLMEQQQWAVWWRYRMFHGLKLGTWAGWFGGRCIASLDQARPPWHRINYPMQEVMFSPHHLREDTVEEYVRVIQKHRLTWLHGYPSQVSLLASLMKEKGLAGSLPDLKIITTGAENLLAAQRELIQSIMGVPVVQHYGLAEGVSNISQHPDGSLRPDQDFAYTEFIPVSGSDPSICRIVGTNYHNPAFPLIRYNTGDIATVDWAEGKPRLLSVDGRQEDYITLPNGLKLGRLDHIFKNLTEVREAQIYQPELTRVVFRVVRGAKYDVSGQEGVLLAEARKRLGKTVNIEIDYVEQIPRTKSGKLRFVISEVGRN